MARGHIVCFVLLVAISLHLAECQSFRNKSKPPKRGSCPPLKRGLMGICSNACQGDSSCRNDLKCCSNGCGMQCLRPVFNTSTGCNDTFTFRSDTSSKGRSLYHRKKISVANCMRACLANTSCEAIEYNIKKNRCYFQSNRNYAINSRSSRYTDQYRRVRCNNSTANMPVKFVTTSTTTMATPYNRVKFVTTSTTTMATPYNRGCASAPCQNGATCTPLRDWSYACQCQRGYEGYTCEKTSGVYESFTTSTRKPYTGDKYGMQQGCSSHPCLHDASCTNLYGGIYHCSCVGNYIGTNCEIWQEYYDPNLIASTMAPSWDPTTPHSDDSDRDVNININVNVNVNPQADPPYRRHGNKKRGHLTDYFNSFF